MRARIYGLGSLALLLGGWGAAAQTKGLPGYRVVLDGTARASHYRDFFDYNDDFRKWLNAQPAAAAAKLLGVKAAEVASLDQAAAKVAAALRQLAADRDRDLLAYAAQRESVLRAYEFRRVRAALEGALAVAQGLDESSWNALRGFITGPFRDLPKSSPATWR